MGSTLCEPDGPGGQTGVNLDDTRGRGKGPGLPPARGREADGGGLWDPVGLG